MSWHALRWSDDEQLRSLIKDDPMASRTVTYSSKVTTLTFDEMRIVEVVSFAKMPNLIVTTKMASRAGHGNVIFIMLLWHYNGIKLIKLQNENRSNAKKNKKNRVTIPNPYLSTSIITFRSAPDLYSVRTFQVSKVSSVFPFPYLFFHWI